MAQLARGLAFALGCLFATSTWAETPVSDRDEAVFKDWTVQCQDNPEGRICQMSQSVPAQEGGPAVFLLSISPGADGKGHYGVATVPVGVYLAHGIEIRVDQRRPFKLLYEVCDQTGCHAGFKLSGAILSGFKRGMDARFRVWTGKARAIDFPVSLRGFSAAHSFYVSEISQ